MFRFAFCSFLFSTSWAVKTSDIEITMKPSLALNGSSFDADTYGKDIMLLFWESTSKEDRMFKQSAWDMLATEKDKHVMSRPLMVADMDCGLKKNVDFCTRWIAFDITNLTYPYIAYSYLNEPFKRYNGSLSYPDLTKFIFEYFERNCAANRKWCTEEEQDFLQKWNGTSLKDLIREHTEMQKETETMVKQFEEESAKMREKFRYMHTTVTKEVEERDHIANLLHHVIQNHGIEAVQVAVDELDDMIDE